MRNAEFGLILASGFWSLVSGHFCVQGSTLMLAAESASLIEKETLGDEVLMVS